jgi:hypothetical protein
VIMKGSINYKTGCLLYHQFMMDDQFTQKE